MADRGGHPDWSQKKPREGVQKGYVKLYVNLGRQDRFFPGEAMQLINRCVTGRQKVGHIGIMPQFTLIEVPKRDARVVMASLSGAYYRNKRVVCRLDKKDKK